MKAFLLFVFLLKSGVGFCLSSDVVFEVSELGVMRALEDVKNFETQKSALLALEAGLCLPELSPRLKMLSVWEISFRTPKTESSNTRFLELLESISASSTDWQIKFDATMSQLYFEAKSDLRIGIVDRIFKTAYEAPDMDVKFQALDKVLKEGIPEQRLKALELLMAIESSPHPLLIKIKVLKMVLDQNFVFCSKALKKLFEIAQSKSLRKEVRKDSLSVILSSFYVLPEEREYANELLESL